MRVLIIGGGISDEREISSRSAKAVFNAVNPEYQKFLYDWDGTEDWLLENAPHYDVALPILHGVGGEDGQIQRLLEKAGIAYLGSDVAASELCIDKVKTQAVLAQNGINVPEQAVVNENEYQSHPIANGPHVLKPILGGSSIDTYVCKQGRINGEKVAASFAKYQTMILERCIIGPEITVPVLDGYDLPVIEIIPGNEFFDYETKYDGSSQEICGPESIDADVQKHAQAVAKKCHEILGCRHLSRVDILLDESKTPYVIEINTMPGLTDQSLFPKAAAHIGMSMPELVEYFVQLAAKSATTS